MHFHLPKPMHGWREFAGEVGIIVMGVLIALGAENMIERWHWREQGEIATASFADELGRAAMVAYERRIIQPCLQGRIGELATALKNGRGAWKASPMRVTNKLYRNVMPVAYRGPSRPLPTDAWRNALADGVLNHMAGDRVALLSGLYSQVAAFDALQKDEAKAGAAIAALGYDRSLDDRERTEMLGKLAEVDRINSLMALVADQIIEAARAYKLALPVADVEKDRRQFVQEQRATRGQCVRDLPLSLN